MTAPSLDVEMHALVAFVVLSAQHTLPRLTVNITPDTGGKQWVVDRCCQRIWLSSTLVGAAMVAALRAAIAVLDDAAEARRPLIPSQRCHAPVGVG